jgi:hypothetical protein
MKSDLIDLELMLHAMTTKAILASSDGDKARAVWLPMSEIECDSEPKVGRKNTVTMPEWLATEKGLV